MFGDKKVLADLKEESGLNYFDKDQVEKAINIANKSVVAAKQIINQASLTIKSERKNTKIFTPLWDLMSHYIEEELLYQKLMKLKKQKKKT